MSGAPAKPTDEYVRRRKSQRIELIPARPRTLKQRTLFALAGAVFLPIFAIYKGLIGWWLEPRSRRRSDQRLRETVRCDLAFLFERFGARFVPNDAEYKDGKAVTLESDRLRFEASWDRGEYFLRVAPLHAPMDWEHIEEVLLAINSKAPINANTDGLGELARILEPQLPLIEEAFAPNNYASIIKVIREVEGARRQEFLERWSRNAQIRRDHPDTNSSKKVEIQTLGLRDYPDV